MIEAPRTKGGYGVELPLKREQFPQIIGPDDAFCGDSHFNNCDFCQVALLTGLGCSLNREPRDLR